jgi:glycosyltransferase involved in cell wall biosynthesis
MGAVLETYARLAIEGHRVDVVPTFHPQARASSAGYLASAVRSLVTDRARRRSIYHVHLSEGGSFLREGVLVLVGALRGSPVLASLHGSDHEALRARRPGLARVEPLLARHVLRRADVVCGLGPSAAAALARDVGGAGRFVVLPNAVEVPALPTAPAEEEVVLFGGQLGRRKGVDVLLRAWPAVLAARPAARLLLAGPLLDLSEGDLEVEGVTWLGTLRRDEVAERLEGCRVAVLPSRAEVLPMFLLEAMARARPVVATDVGEVRWLVGRGGRVVGAEDEVALTGALVELLADRSAAAAAGAAARERVTGTFSMEAVGAQLSHLYASLPAAAPEPSRPVVAG